MDRPLTLRFRPDELAELGQLADAAGCSRAEIVRRHWRQRGSGSMAEMAETVAGIAALAVQIDERLSGLESRPSEPSAAPDLTPIVQRMERVERALGSLISAVERLYQPAGMTAPRTDPAPQPTAMPTGKKPAPIGGFSSWVREQPWAHNDETPPERARRLLPTYNAQFDPPHQLPGG